jgi:hypothetical protein
MKKLFILAVVLIGRVFSYGTPPPPPPPCNTPQCSSGTYCYSNTNACTPCPPGYMYNANPNIGVSSVNLWGCTICPPGTVAASSGSSGCASCLSGTFASSSGSSSCTACPIATFTAASGQSGCAGCTLCVAGQYVFSACNAKSNTVCVSCTSIANCAMTPTCSSASNSQCSTCAAGFFLQNNACVACTTCTNGIQYETGACTSASNRQCATCTNTCPTGSALQGACSGTANPSCVRCAVGSYKTLADGSPCLPCTTTCNPGYQLQAICSSSINSVCTDCPSGSYKALADSSACSPCTVKCAPGFQLNQLCTATVNPQCVPCLVGSYKALPDGSACLPCTNACVPGYQLNQPCSAAVNPQCVPCLAGSYKALPDGSACLPCANTCAPGYQLNQPCSATVNPVCTLCASGTYKMFNDGSACLPCNNNCGPGSYLDSLCTPINNPACSKCPVNTANPNDFSVFNTDCITCPKGSISVAGSASCLQCPLGSATFGNSNCTSCSPGTYADNIGSISCKLCPVGKANANTAANNSSACVTCLPGYTALAGSERCSPCRMGTYENGLRSCLACPGGTYNDLLGQTVCTLCPAGSAHNNVSAISIDACLICDAGKFAEVGSTLCTPCPPGSFTNKTGQANCTLAPPGTFISGNGSTSLQECAPGFYTDQLGSTICAACLPGTYNPLFSSGNIAACLACPLGKFSNTSGTPVCTNTSVGFYQDTPGTQGGLPCPVGTFNNLIGSSSASACVDCYAGQYQSNNGSSMCLVCPVGMYQDTVGNTGCIKCPSGMYNTLVGANALSYCLACPVGTYSPVVGANTSLTCLSTPIGTYSDLPGAGNYKPCPAGFYQNASGQTACTPCTPGTFNVLLGGPNSSFCLPAPPGFFVFFPGTPNASACPAGSWINKYGSTGCELCLPGTFSPNAGSTRCLPCPVGTFAVSAGLTQCDVLGLPAIAYTNINADEFIVTVSTNFTATFHLPYMCSHTCMFLINARPVYDPAYDPAYVVSGAGVIILPIRPGLDEITVLYNGTFTSSTGEWSCGSTAQDYNRCTTTPANTVITSVTLIPEKSLLNPYADPNVLLSRTLILNNPVDQTYVFPIKGLEAAVNYTFTLMLSITNSAYELPPFSLGVMATLPGSPTGPVQNLVKYFLGLSVEENANLEQGNLQVHWDPPAIEQQHGPINGYKVDYVQEARTFITYGPIVETVVTPQTKFSFLTTDTTVILSNLRPDTEYNITVYPFTAAKGSGPGNSIVLHTQVSAPPKPPVLTLLKREETNITVSWSNLTNATGIITKVWIVIEPYDAAKAPTSEFVIVPPNNSALPLLPFPHENTRGIFGPYNVSNPCQDKIIGYSFHSLKSNTLCGGICDNVCELGTPMLDPTTILATNNKNLTNDNFMMEFNTTDGNISTRFVPYLSMKKRFVINTTQGGLAGFGKIVLGDGKINPNSLLNNSILLPALSYRVRFIVFTSEVLYTVSDPLDIPPFAFPVQVDLITAVYMALIIVIVVLVCLCIILMCLKHIFKRRNDKKSIEDDKQYLEKEILKYTNSKDVISKDVISKDVISKDVISKDVIVYSNSPVIYNDVPMLPPKVTGIYKTTNASVNNPLYWTNIYSPEYLDKPDYDIVDNPDYASGYASSYALPITDRNKYMDVSHTVNNSFTDDRYFDVTSFNANNTIYEDEETRENIFDVPAKLYNKPYFHP